MLLFESANVANANYLTLMWNMICLHKNVRSIRRFIDFISEVFLDFSSSIIQMTCGYVFTPMTSFSDALNSLEQFISARPSFESASQ